MDRSDRKWEIYTMADPRNGEVRYVGVTHIARKRFNRHIAEARRGLRTHRHDWIRSLLKCDLIPAYSVIEQGLGDRWAEAECRWIEHYRQIGFDLTNLTSGGEGTHGYIPGAETREKMAAAKRGRQRTPETKAKIKAFFTGRKLSVEHVAKVAAARIGKKHSIEARASMAAAKKGKALSAEHRAAISASLKGKTKTFSREHIARMSASRKGKPWSAKRIAAHERGISRSIPIPV